MAGEKIRIKTQKCYEVWIEDKEGISYGESCFIYGTRKEAEEAGRELKKDFEQEFGEKVSVKILKCYDVWLEDGEKNQISDSTYVYGNKCDAEEEGRWLREQELDYRAKIAYMRTYY